jgi:DNA-binding beta-propeller fold protein YncE
MKVHWCGLSRQMGRWIITCALILPLVLVNLIPAVPVVADSGLIGMVADNAGRVHIFDATSNTILGTVNLKNFLNSDDWDVGDCCISRDGTLGFVTDYRQELWVIDLTHKPPVLASNTPIPISTYGGDIVVTPDGKYVVVVDGYTGTSLPISVVSIASRSEVCTLAIADNISSVDVLMDGSVLVSSWNIDVGSQVNSRIYRLTINNAGQLTYTGEALPVSYPYNVYGAAFGNAGFAVKYKGISSFLVHGLSSVDTRSFPGLGVCGAINTDGNTIYARSTRWDGPDQSAVVSYRFNPVTGALGAAPLFTFPVAECDYYTGLDQLAITPDGSRLYVPEGNLLKVYDARTGGWLSTISDGNFGELTGICFQPSLTTGVPAGNPWILLGVFAMAFAVAAAMVLRCISNKTGR